MMDFLKTQAPFWKKEHLAGESGGRWIEAMASYDEALRRWGDRPGKFNAAG